MRNIIIAIIALFIVGCGTESNIDSSTDKIKKSKLYTSVQIQDITLLGTNSGVEEHEVNLRKTSFNSPVFKAKDEHNEDTVAVYTMFLKNNSELLVGGNFGYINNQAHNSIAMLNKDGSLSEKFTANLNGEVYSINSQKNGEYFIGGYFTSYNESSVNGLVKIDSKGKLLSIFDAKNEAYKLAVVKDILIYDKYILLSGLFINFNDEKSGLIVLNTDTMTVNNKLTESFNIAGHMYKSYVTKKENIIVVGEFDESNSFKTNNLAMFDKKGNLIDFDRELPEIEGRIFDVIMDNDNIYLTGDFVAKNKSHIYENLIILSKDGKMNTINEISKNGSIYSIQIDKSTLFLSTDSGLITKNI